MLQHHLKFLLLNNHCFSASLWSKMMHRIVMLNRNYFKLLERVTSFRTRMPLPEISPFDSGVRLLLRSFSWWKVTNWFDESMLEWFFLSSSFLKPKRSLCDAGPVLFFSIFVWFACCSRRWRRSRLPSVLTSILWKISLKRGRREGRTAAIKYIPGSMVFHVIISMVCQVMSSKTLVFK